jgi:hypothetical protein
MPVAVEVGFIEELMIQWLAIRCDECFLEFDDPSQAMFLTHDQKRMIWFGHMGDCVRAIFCRESPTGGGNLQALLTEIGVR